MKSMKAVMPTALNPTWKHIHRESEEDKVRDLFLGRFRGTFMRFELPDSVLIKDLRGKVACVD